MIVIAGTKKKNFSDKLTSADLPPNHFFLVDIQGTVYVKKRIRDFRLFSACHLANRKTLFMFGGVGENGKPGMIG